MKKRLFTAVIAFSLIVLSFGTYALAAQINPWAQKSANLFSNTVETTFTPSWLTTSDDKQYGCQVGRYIKNSWCKVEEGNRTDYHKSDDYYKPDTTWVHTYASLSDSPFHTASMSYGWGYQ